MINWYAVEIMGINIKWCKDSHSLGTIYDYYKGINDQSTYDNYLAIL